MQEQVAQPEMRVRLETQVLLEMLDFRVGVVVEEAAHLPLVRVVLVMQEAQVRAVAVVVVLVVVLQLQELREELELVAPQVLLVIQVLLGLDTQQVMQVQMEATA